MTLPRALGVILIWRDCGTEDLYACLKFIQTERQTACRDLLLERSQRSQLSGK